MESLIGVDMPLDYVNWMMTHLSESDVYSPYGMVISPEEANSLQIDENYIKGMNVYDENAILQAGKLRRAVWVVSNCHTPSKRELAIRELAKLIIALISSLRIQL